MSGNLAANQPSYIICECCDTVYHKQVIQRNEVAICTRCENVLYRSGSANPQEWLALTIAAAVVFLIINVSPLFKLSLFSLSNEITLLEAATYMLQDSTLVIGSVAILVIFIIPALQICLLLWLLTFASFGRQAPWFIPIMHLLRHVRLWSMTEVFMLGLLVSIIKLSGDMQIKILPGTYMLAIFTVLITLIAKRSIVWLWDALPTLDKQNIFSKMAVL